jgi:hypothetical protein
MKRKSHSRARRNTTKSVLQLPDLEHAKAAVLNSLTSPDAQRGYRHAIDGRQCNEELSSQHAGQSS